MPTKKQQLSCYVSDEVYGQVRRVAEGEGRTMAGWVSWVIQRALGVAAEPARREEPWQERVVREDRVPVGMAGMALPASEDEQRAPGYVQEMPPYEDIPQAGQGNEAMAKFLAAVGHGKRRGRR